MKYWHETKDGTNRLYVEVGDGDGDDDGDDQYSDFLITIMKRYGAVREVRTNTKDTFQKIIVLWRFDDNEDGMMFLDKLEELRYD